MTRVNYFKVKYQIYPASIDELGGYRSDLSPRYNWDSEAVAKEPIIDDFENIFDLSYWGDDKSLHASLARKIGDFIQDEGRKAVYGKCPIGDE